jgi:ElaB/YqjD/DUF883 family membrane-anchored ribosome-binding protein
MMLTRNNMLSEKRDLHVGGLGVNAPAAVATRVSRDASAALHSWQPLAKKARSAMQNATSVVRGNPLSAIALVGLVGVAAGYLLSRRY